MVAPASSRKTPSAPSAPGKAAPKADKAKPAAKKSDPGMGQDQASFSAKPDTSKTLALPTLQQGELEVKGSIKGQPATEPGGEAKLEQVDLEGKAGEAGFKLKHVPNQGTDAEAALQANPNAKLTLGLSHAKGKTRVKGQVDLKLDGTTLRASVDSDSNFSGALSQRLTPQLEATGQVERKNGHTNVGGKLKYAPAKNVELSLEGTHDGGKKRLGGKARLKADATTVELGLDASKQLSATLSQQVTDSLNLGVTHKNGRTAGRVEYQQDGLSLATELGEVSSVEVGYKKDHFEIKGFARSNQDVGFKFGYSTRF